MTVEELKDKFHEVRENRRRVTALRAKASELRQSAMGRAIRYDKDRVMTTPMNYQEQALIEAADLDEEAEKLVDEGDKLRMELLRLINQLEDIEDQTVLIGHYFNNKPFSGMAKDDNYDRTTYWHRKESALEKIAKLSTDSTDSTKGIVV